MNKKPVPKVPQSKIPILGQTASNEEVIKNAIDEALATLTQHLDPILQNLGGAIKELQGRLAVVEEMVSATVVDILSKKVYDKIQNKLNYPDTQPQGLGKPEEKK